MDRCEMLSVFSKASDDDCSFLEELLLEFFEEYMALYDFMLDEFIVDDVLDIEFGSMEENGNRKVTLTLNEKLYLIEENRKKLEKFLEERLEDTRVTIEYEEDSTDTIVIYFERCECDADTSC